MSKAKTKKDPAEVAAAKALRKASKNPNDPNYVPPLTYRSDIPEDLEMNRQKKPIARATELDYASIQAALGTVTKHVKNGKFKKALSCMDPKIRNELNSFLDLVVDTKAVDDSSEELDILIDVIRIGKTFYEEGRSEEFIPDSVYDALIPVLKKYADEPTGYISANGKTEVVDAEYAELAINMNKAYAVSDPNEIPEGVKETDTVDKWLTRCYKKLGKELSDTVTIVITPKLDGIAVRGEISKDNRLINPMTRGTSEKSILIKGLNGLRVLNKDAKPFNNKPFGIQFECFMTEEAAAGVSEYYGLDRPYVSPRHAASGVVNRLCVSPDAKVVKFLSFYPINSSGLSGTYLDNLDRIKELGNCPDIMEPVVVTGTHKKVLKAISRCFKKMGNTRACLEYPIDGIVIAFADYEDQKAIGRSGRSNGWQIALKFDPSSAVGIADRVVLTPGKKGFRTINLYLRAPIMIDGVRYDHVPILSYELFDKMDVREGDKVRIHRVGDVIPTVTIEERNHGAKFDFADTCPFCGKKLIIEAKKLKCTNAECSANKAGRILNFLEVAGIKGVGEAFVAAIIAAGITSVNEILSIDPDDFKIPGYSAERTKTFAKQLRKAVSKMADHEVITALGFNGVGPETAKKMIAENHDLIQEAINSYGKDCAWYRIPGSTESETKMWSEILDVFRYVTKFTGDISNATRIGHTGIKVSEDTKHVIDAIGWDLVDGRRFDVLLVPSYNHSSKKVDHAVKKGIPMLTESDFIKQHANAQARAIGLPSGSEAIQMISEFHADGTKKSFNDIIREIRERTLG